MRRRDDRGAADMRLARAADRLGHAERRGGELTGEDEREKRRVEVEMAVPCWLCVRREAAQRVRAAGGDRGNLIRRTTANEMGGITARRFNCEVVCHFGLGVGVVERLQCRSANRDRQTISFVPIM